MTFTLVKFIITSEFKSGNIVGNLRRASAFFFFFEKKENFSLRKNRLKGVHSVPKLPEF